MSLLIKVGENELHHCAAAHAAVADGGRVSTSIQLAGPLIQERFAAGKLAGNQKRQEDRRVAICAGEDQKKKMCSGREQESENLDRTG
jgi:hypothetical protein